MTQQDACQARRAWHSAQCWGRQPTIFSSARREAQRSEQLVQRPAQRLCTTGFDKETLTEDSSKRLRCDSVHRCAISSPDRLWPALLTCFFALWPPCRWHCLSWRAAATAHRPRPLRVLEARAETPELATNPRRAAQRHQREATQPPLKAAPRALTVAPPRRAEPRYRAAQARPAAAVKREWQLAETREPRRVATAALRAQVQRRRRGGAVTPCTTAQPTAATAVVGCSTSTVTLHTAMRVHGWTTLDRASPSAAC